MRKRLLLLAFVLTAAALAFGQGQGGTSLFNDNAYTGCIQGCTYVITLENTAAPFLVGAPVSAAETVNVYRFWNSTQKLLGATGCVGVSTADSGGHVDVGVYSLSGTTLTRVWHTGALSTTTGNQVCATSLTTTSMQPVTNYYLAYCADNTTSAIGTIYPSSGATSNEASDILGGTNATANTYGHDATDVCTSGVLPGTMTSTNITNSTTNVQIPYVAIFN